MHASCANTSPTRPGEIPSQHRPTPTPPVPTATTVTVFVESIVVKGAPSNTKCYNGGFKYNNNNKIN